MDLRPEPGPRNAPSVRVGAILVSLYSWTCVTIGVAIARFIIGRIHRVAFGLDDVTILCASIVYIGSTVSWQHAVDGGLGEHFSGIERQNAAKYFKATYAATLLQLLAMGFAKLSSAFLVGRVAPQSRRGKAILFGSVTLWILYSMFAFAFECGLPRPWIFDPPNCAHGGPLISIIIFNMLSDLVLTAWIFPMLRPLKVNREKCLNVAVLFGSRIVVPLAAIGQVWAVIKVIRGKDPTWDGFELAILDRVVTSLSLIVANLPRIMRFVGMGGSGMLYPRITETEIVLSARTASDGASLVVGEPLVSMNCKQDESTSTSSPCEHQDGVMIRQEVMTEAKDSDNAD